MTSTIFDKDTLLDLTVNIVPLGILAFFLVAFVLVNPWSGGSLLERVLQIGLIAVPFVGLAILTYAAAKRIETGEEEAGH